MLLVVAKGDSDHPAPKNENGLRRLLSRTGGRLPALQAVSKSDAEAERKQHLCKQNAYICQDLEPQPSQNGGSDIGQLFWRDAPRNEFSLTARTRATILEAIKSRSRNGHSHIAFGPHLLRRKGVWQRFRKREMNMVSHLRVGRCCAQRNNRNQIASPRQSWNNDNNWAALDHFRYDETAKITQQYFTQFGIIHQRHLSARNGSLENLEGWN
jgi:hypothetical protein